jgi:hypothetical protein
MTLQTTVMNQIKHFNCVPALNHTTNINLTCALNDHLDINPPHKHRKHHPCNPDHIPHLPPHQQQNHHTQHIVTGLQVQESSATRQAMVFLKVPQEMAMMGAWFCNHALYFELIFLCSVYFRR